MPRDYHLPSYPMEARWADADGFADKVSADGWLIAFEQNRVMPYVTGMGGYLGTLPARVMLVVYRFFEAGSSLVVALGSLLVGERKERWTEFGKDFVMLSHSILEVVTGAIGILCPVVSWKIEYRLYDCELIQKRALFTECVKDKEFASAPNSSLRIDPDTEDPSTEPYVPPLLQHSQAIHIAAEVNQIFEEHTFDEADPALKRIGEAGIKKFLQAVQQEAKSEATTEEVKRLEKSSISEEIPGQEVREEVKEAVIRAVRLQLQERGQVDGNEVWQGLKGNMLPAEERLVRTYAQKIQTKINEKVQGQLARSSSGALEGVDPSRVRQMECCMILRFLIDSLKGDPADAAANYQLMKHVLLGELRRPTFLAQHWDSPVVQNLGEQLFLRCTEIWFNPEVEDAGDQVAEFAYAVMKYQEALYKSEHAATWTELWQESVDAVLAKEAGVDDAEASAVMADDALVDIVIASDPRNGARADDAPKEQVRTPEERRAAAERNPDPFGLD